MEFFQEILFTVGVYLLVFVIPKLVSIVVTSSDVAKGKSVSVSADLMGKRVMNEPQHAKKSVVCDQERVIKLDEEEFLLFTSSVICVDSEIADNERVGVVGLEEKSVEESVCEEKEKESEFDSGGLKEHGLIVVEDEFVENLVEESPERAEFGEIRIELVKGEVGVAKSEEVGVLEGEGTIGTEIDGVMVKDVVGVAESDEVLVSVGGDGNESNGVSDNVAAEEEDGLLDDWEGIERTDLEKCFGAAVVFVGSKTNAGCISNLENDTKMQLYGLHKIAIEGPCHELQPMALKVSARAKWNAWQRLGNMSPEVAMEQYVTLLSGKIPGWLGDDAYGGEQVFSDVKASRTSLQKQPDTEKERKLDDLKLFAEECGVIMVESSNSKSRDK
ncbi:acyl-CoA-binding domain-containing protein 3-like isoform X2 [Cornus florida]|uniref:acyl-CoA-binding domain-containing protein 3-like isoform X2 n=1 Tax=Cornus florida TaxID=4283 RepID=UPI00289DAB5D|nr:acyl-CoA-binding domain-containing protein 3-like isoform X2 [Cornus florida]